MGICGLDAFGSEKVSVMRSCESSGCIKGREFFD
jgi:hypothetical protein